MKKYIIFLLIAALMSGAVFAQDRSERQRPERQRLEPPVPQTITGTLKLERGSVAIQSGETVYIAPILTRYIGFINGLREDAGISIEGFIFRNMIHPVKVTIDGKSYDFNMGPGAGMQNMFQRNGFGYMRRNFNNERAPAPRQRLQETDRPNRGNRQNRSSTSS